MTGLKILAPAKINLHLQVTSKRNDGYHNLISLFQMVSLYDEIYIEKIKNNKIIVEGNFDCALKDNLIYKALHWLKELYSVNGGFVINCRKNIPAGAGLGGGSSDAAAVLLGTLSLLKIETDKDELCKGALELGSDVPFFLGASTAIAMGRGEDLIPLKTRTDLFLLITESGFHSSTREAFKMINPDSFKTMKVLSPGDINRRYSDLSPSEWDFKNSFHSYLYAQNPLYEKIITLLDKHGAEYSSITGTGSSVFAVFSDMKKAISAQKELKNNNILAHKVKMLANRPKPVYN